MQTQNNSKTVRKKAACLLAMLYRMYTHLHKIATTTTSTAATPKTVSGIKNRCNLRTHTLKHFNKVEIIYCNLNFIAAKQIEANNKPANNNNDCLFLLLICVLICFFSLVSNFKKLGIINETK